MQICHPKTDNSIQFAYVVVPYYVYKEIDKLDGLVLELKPTNNEDTKVKLKVKLQ